MAYNSYSNSNRNNSYVNRNNNSYRDKKFQNDNKPIVPKKIPDNYIDLAEEYMLNKSKSITTSKIRRIYTLITEIYNEEKLRTDSSLTEDNISAVNMARIRIAYECGRESSVKIFVTETSILEYLKGINGSRDEFIKFSKYIEALVAYHKYFGGREN